MAEIKKITIDFLSYLEGYHQALKELHWQTTNKSEHLLTDDIDGEVLGFEDRIAEIVMGCLDVRFGIGDLKPMVPNSKDLSSLIKELEKDLIEFKDKIGDDKKYAGIQNVLDDFMEAICKWKYLKTLK